MIGILLMYFIGKHFYELAGKYEKNKWGYAILGVATYYLGTFIGGIILVLFLELSNPGSIDTFNDTLLGLLAVPFGLLALVGLSKYLKSRFENEYGSKNSRINSEILDEDFIN